MEEILSNGTDEITSANDNAIAVEMAKDVSADHWNYFIYICYTMMQTVDY